MFPLRSKVIMQFSTGQKSALKFCGISGVAIVSGCIGAALAGNFGASNLTISYVDFISVVLTALGVLLATVTLFVALLAVIGWTSIESRLRSHSIEFIGSELKDDKPLARMVQAAVREAVYQGVVSAPEGEDEDEEAKPEDEPVQ